MPEFYFPRHAENATQLCGSDPDTRQLFGNCNGLHGNDTLKPGFAYDVTLDGRSATRGVSRVLNSPEPEQRAYLAECTAQFGQDTVTLARFHEKFLEGVDLWELGKEANSSLSSGAAVLAGRTESFQDALRDYQKALIALNKSARKGTADAGRKARLRQKVHIAYERLNTHFHQELKTLVPESHRGKNKGSALTSAERGQTLAERNKGRRIHVADMEQGKAVNKLANSINYAGKGAVALDGGLRLQAVHEKYQNGKGWERELAVQSGGFLTSGGVGSATTRLAVNMSRILVVGGPVGWVVLIGSTIVVGAILASQTDQTTQRFIGNAWDSLFGDK
ncbi:MAG: hypothetical protein R6W87_10070 [Halospina sp.]